MQFNKRQKRTLIGGLLLITAALLIWLGFGAEIFTKTQVLVEKKDDLFGTSYKEWKDKFVLGLDYTSAFIALVAAIAIGFTWRHRTRR